MMTSCGFTQCFDVLPFIIFLLKLYQGAKHSILCCDNSKNKAIYIPKMWYISFFISITKLLKIHKNKHISSVASNMFVTRETYD